MKQEVVNEMVEVKVLKVKVSERKTKDGRKFNAYTTYTKNGRAVDLKFKMTVTNAPTENCSITVNVDDMSYNTSGLRPVLWVSAIQSFGDYNVTDIEANREKINEFFA